MAIAIEVAKVSGALRCDRWGDELDGDTSADVRKTAEPTLLELLDNTAAYARAAQKKILEDLENRRHS